MMTKNIVMTVLASTVAVGIGAVALARPSWKIGKSDETPLGDKWWPNPLWGAGDEAGSTNWYKKPEVIMRAHKEIDKGKVYVLAHPYEDTMPLLPTRNFELRIPGNPTGGPGGENQLTWNEEFVIGELGQVGTQFDALGHIGVRMPDGSTRYYNGFTEKDVSSPFGLKKLGVEKLHPIYARGFLLDIAGAKGVEMLDKGYEITMADVKAALKRQKMTNVKFAPGDGVFFYTGWSKLWKKDNKRYVEGCPGIGMEVAKWLSDEVKAGVVGADNWPTEVAPNPDPTCAFCVHQHLLTRHGIVNQENMRLEELVRDRVYRFAYVYSPAPMVGATGSMGAPLAID